APHSGPGAPRGERGAPNTSGGNGAAPPRISEAQHRRLEARINELGLDRARVKRWMSRALGVEHFPDLDVLQYQQLDDRLEAFAERIAIETEAGGAPQASAFG
ncbi:hypothetical protein CKO41_18105, partial [Thiococcus pfennigii]|nr:hypothetical protein [Thiococcus pfennigii]